ncbi:glycosyltransferase family 2 protein [Azoarcus olearius]|uniref:Glycosyltransferase n=1 Tax=Azoarcus sp. (strain BH72) TaxID=418699 RepID=A1KAM0_AZOSB|nr:glycosyltransferase [Azoarcus olearius]CAL95876.1 glycosyltransferase [Azoarcus olearius]
MLSVVFATFNGKRTLPTMLEALCRLEPPPGSFELIAVDNGSTDVSIEVLQSFADRLPLTILEQPARGKNRALNLGISRVRGDLVVFTDDDVVPREDWLVALHRAAEERAQASLFGGTILPHWEIEPPHWLLNSAPLGVTYAITAPDIPSGPIFPGLIWGPNMMVRRAVLDAGHRFNENVGPSAGQYIMGSETEFNIRIAQHGCQTWFCPDAVVGHIIRDFQMTQEWVIRRGYRFGRNKCLQDTAAQTVASPWLFNLANFPRWMVRKVIQDSIGGHLARALGNEAAAVARLWDAAFYRGYIFQAQQLRTGQSG